MVATIWSNKIVQYERIWVEPYEDRSSEWQGESDETGVMSGSSNGSDRLVEVAQRTARAKEAKFAHDHYLVNNEC